MKEFVGEYKTKMWMRIVVFAMMGMGYDVIVTTIQKILGGKLDINAVQTASTWMFLVYGTIPLIVYPVLFVLKKMKIPKVLIPLVFLLLFYIAEYSWGATFHKFGIEAWNYNWYTPSAFNTANGYISFHPAIIVTWLIFINLAIFLDNKLRSLAKYMSDRLARQLS